MRAKNTDLFHGVARAVCARFDRPIPSYGKNRFSLSIIVVIYAS